MQLYRVSGRSLGEFVTQISLTKQLIRGAPKYVFKISQNSNLFGFIANTLSLWKRLQSHRGHEFPNPTSVVKRHD